MGSILTTLVLLLVFLQYIVGFTSLPQSHSHFPHVATNLYERSILIPPFANESTEEYPSALHKILVEPILDKEQASTALSIAEAYALETGSWAAPDSDRHATYATCDFVVEDCAALSAFLEETGFHDRVWDIMNRAFGVDHEEMTYLDFFCAHYEAKEAASDARHVMEELEPHRDGSLLSFTVTLSDPSSFEGGGTLFDCLRDVESDLDEFQSGGVIRPTRAGEGVFHSGKVLHGGHRITQGTRTVLVGFVDVSEWRQQVGSLSEACRDWGRMDAAMKRYAKMKERDGEVVKPFWLPSGALRTAKPQSSLMETLVEPELQRRKRLEAEDELLRTILLPEGSIAGIPSGIEVL